MVQRGHGRAVHSTIYHGYQYGTHHKLNSPGEFGPPLPEKYGIISSLPEDSGPAPHNENTPPPTKEYGPPHHKEYGLPTSKK